MIRVRYCPVPEGEHPSTVAHRLLDEMRREVWPEMGEEPELVTGRWGKPEWRDYPTHYFNLSHSGRWVMCAVADCAVGVDIQQQDTAKRRVIRKFTWEEQALLETSPERFCDIWVKKEAYLKAVGRGLTLKLDSFSVLPLEENIVEDYVIQCVRAPEEGYSCGLCYKK